MIDFLYITRGKSIFYGVSMLIGIRMGLESSQLCKFARSSGRNIKSNASDQMAVLYENDVSTSLVTHIQKAPHKPSVMSPKWPYGRLSGTITCQKLPAIIVTVANTTILPNHIFELVLSELTLAFRWPINVCWKYTSGLYWKSSMSYSTPQLLCTLTWMEFLQLEVYEKPAWQENHSEFSRSHCKGSQFSSCLP